MRRRLYPFVLTAFCASVIMALSFTAMPFAMPESGGEDDCPKPNMVTVQSISDTSAIVTWQQSDSVTGMKLLVTDLVDPGMTVEYEPVSSPFLVTGLAACGLYSIQLSAACGDSTSGYTEAIMIETDGCCRVPSSFRVAEVESDQAILQWDSVRTSDSYVLRVKGVKENDEAWDTVSLTGTGFVLTDLEKCTAYEAQILSICDLDSTEFSTPLLIQTTGCGVCTSADYCETGGIDATNTWVDSFALANIRMKTGSNDGYFAYATEQTALERGRTYDYYVAPGFAGDTCPQYIRMWFDLDQDGIFNDSTEMLIDYVDSTGFGTGGSIMIADTLVRGVTRLRIAVTPTTDVDTLPPSPCGLFNFGEVEDYCIRVDEPCPIADNLDTLLVTETSAILSWDKLENAFGYLYANTALGEERGEFTSTGDTMVELNDLDPCTEYVFYLVSVCPQDSNGQAFQFKTKCETAVIDLLPLVSELNVYPNPFRSDFTLEITPEVSLQGQLRISSMTGQILFDQRLDLISGQTHVQTIAGLSDAPPGMYLMILQADDRIHTSKLIKGSY